jgi:HAD superfamily hydrolase (TIGR01549 family)
MRLDALCLDLFGTIVFFDLERLPRRIVAGEQKIVTIADLEECLARSAPGVTVEDFLTALASVSTEIARENANDGREVPTHERFRRALTATGACGSDVHTTAVAMAAQHMATLADAVVCPPDRRAILSQLASRYPLALVSNFDHGPTAHGLLSRFGLLEYFRAVVVSADVGVLKPAAEIFELACARLATVPSNCLHVGDSREADVLGATAAGMAAVLVGDGDPAPAAGAISDLRELPQWLAARYS